MGSRGIERGVTAAIRGRETFDGAGVRLSRVFGFGNEGDFDPFLLLDEFGSEDPEEYLPGFPWHPHRGIETVTWLIEGSVRHGDSLGSGGVIGPGDLQWMTAGSGIIHEEMPLRSPRGIRGLQLWVNLPRSEKMRDPAYRGAKSSDAPVARTEGASVRVLAGVHEGLAGPVAGLARDPAWFDVRLEAGARLELPAPAGQTAFAYLLAGSLLRAGVPSNGAAERRGAARTVAEAGRCLLFGEGDWIGFEAGPEGARFAFARAEPLRESVAWRGPIVMNSEAELDLAFREYRDGTFVKKGRPA